LRKIGLTVALATAVIGAGAGCAAAGAYDHEPIAAADALPAWEILDSVRELGLAPKAQPVRRGPYYVLHATDPYGIELRVVADAQFGDIISIEPARPLRDFPPYYVRAPHIIHVPPPRKGATVDRPENEDAVPPDGGEQNDFMPNVLVVPQRRGAVPLPKPRAEALSVPRADTKLSPIRPIPKTGAPTKID